MRYCSLSYDDRAKLLFFYVFLSFSTIAMISLIGGVILKEYLASAVIVLMLSGGEALESYAVTKAGYDLQVTTQENSWKFPR